MWNREQNAMQYQLDYALNSLYIPVYIQLQITSIPIIFSGKVSQISGNLYVIMYHVCILGNVGNKDLCVIYDKLI